MKKRSFQLQTTAFFGCGFVNLALPKLIRPILSGSVIPVFCYGKAMLRLGTSVSCHYGLPFQKLDAGGTSGEERQLRA